MNDSFSLLAKSIRQNKINKLELLNNIKQISESISQKDYSIKKLITIQKFIRGHLFRKKYSLLLDEINIKTVIDYLLEKKKKRIHEHSDEIISFFVRKYINKRKKKKSIIYEQYKIHCANLIKARFKGILVRQKIKRQLDKIKNNNYSNKSNKRYTQTINGDEEGGYGIEIRGRGILSDEKNENGLNKYFETTNKKNNKIYNYNINSSKRLSHNYNLNSLKIKPNNLSESLQKNNYESNKNVLGFNLEEKEIDNFLSNNDINKYRYSLNEVSNKIPNGINSNKDKKKFISDKNVKKRLTREESSYLKKQIIDSDLNNISNKKKIYSSKNINGYYPNEEIYEKEVNNYYLMDEREIKPLKTKDILNCKNPFGLRDSTYKKSNTFKESPKTVFSSQNSLSNPSKSNLNSSKIINRDEKPLGGNKIDYNELFGQDGEIKFEGDPFGGAKQFETNKDKINNIKKKSNKKKPIYDARKAIEEAKLKEEKNAKNKNNDKNKHNKFREFLKEMKKININKDDDKNIEKDLKILKRNSENIVYKINGIKLYEEQNIININKDNNNNNIEYEERKNIEIDKNIDNKNSINKKPIKREKSLNKSTNQILRKKLHELEKTPTPALNKKGIKSRVKCWTNTENQKAKKEEKDKEKENYLEKQIIELNFEINKINNMFNIENYFEQKETKMNKFRNIPYIKKCDEYVKNVDINEYEDLLGEINKEYKILK